MCRQNTPSVILLKGLFITVQQLNTDHPPLETFILIDKIQIINCICTKYYHIIIDISILHTLDISFMKISALFLEKFNTVLFRLFS